MVLFRRNATSATKVYGVRASASAKCKCAAAAVCLFVVMCDVTGLVALVELTLRCYIIIEDHSLIGRLGEKAFDSLTMFFLSPARSCFCFVFRCFVRILHRPLHRPTKKCCTLYVSAGAREPPHRDRRQMASTSKRRKLRQAVESSDGSVSVLCYACRRTADPTVQRALSSFFAPSVRNVLRSSETASAEEELLLCSKCRRVMDMKRDSSGSGIASHTRVLPQIARMRSYQRIAADQHLPFVLKESEATGLMRQDCVLCGIPAPAEGHGLSRLCFWPEGLVRPERGGWMGPYHRDNLITACSMCNLMKGYRRPRAFVEAARHIATHRAGQGDFGLYPRRFRDNVSKRSRSCYITASSTHTKTHALTNEAFARIVGQPCRYCGKEPRPPHHYNGLDRLDSECRVYTEETCVACCGDCNVMKVHALAGQNCPLQICVVPQ